MIYFYKPLNRVLVSFVSFFIILIVFSLVFLTRVKASTVFTDNFNDNSISGSLDVSNGTLVESNGVLSMTDFTGGGSDEKKAAVTSFPAGTDYTITAKVRVDSWTDGPTARVGVSVLSDPNPD